MRKRTLLIVAALATVLAVALGSAATAAHLVTSAQIKDHTIKVKDLRKNAVKKLRGQTGPAGATGATGPAGPAGKSIVGPQGPAGADGKDGVDGKDGKDGVDGVNGQTVLTVQGASVSTQGTGATATCPEGTTLIGGGGEASGNGYLVYSKPNGANGWVVKVKDANGAAGNASAYAICG